MKALSPAQRELLERMRKNPRALTPRELRTARSLTETRPPIVQPANPSYGGLDMGAGLTPFGVELAEMLRPDAHGRWPGWAAAGPLLTQGPYTLPFIPAPARSMNEEIRTSCGSGWAYSPGLLRGRGSDRAAEYALAATLPDDVAGRLTQGDYVADIRYRGVLGAEYLATGAYPVEPAISLRYCPEGRSVELGTFTSGAALEAARAKHAASQVRTGAVGELIAFVGRPEESLWRAVWLCAARGLRTTYGLGDGMHPVDHASAFAEARADKDQVAATVHCPYMLSHFATEDVWCLAGEGDDIYAARLSSHPSWGGLVGELDAGEFWSSVGEDWVLAHPDRVTLPDAVHTITAERSAL